MVITTNTSLSVRNEIREALKSINTNPFSMAGLHEDTLNAEDEILIQTQSEPQITPLWFQRLQKKNPKVKGYTDAEIQVAKSENANKIKNTQQSR